MKYTCVIADDEPPARKLLADYVSRIPHLELLGTCSNGVETKAFLQKNAVDIMLLDIRMPLMTGMEVLMELPERPITILVSAYEEYALKGYELDVIDYLMKPVSFDRFKKAIDKATEYLSVQVTTHGKKMADYFFVKTDTRIVKLLFAEVSAIEAQREYIKIITPTRKVMSLMSLSGIAEVLPADFVRIHRSYIINMRQIDEVRSNEVLIGKDMYPISRNFRDSFFLALGDRKLF